MARPSTASRRYAEAVFELAQRERAEERWDGELAAVARVAQDEGIGRMLDNPAIPFTEREAALRKALAGKVADQILNLARLLAERSRLEILPQVASEYHRLYNRQRGVVEAVVTSAQPLTRDERTAVQERVDAMTGATVELEERVDESLIGGLTVRVGDRLLDASVRGRLERLRSTLVAGARSR